MPRTEAELLALVYRRSHTIKLRRRLAATTAIAATIVVGLVVTSAALGQSGRQKVNTISPATPTSVPRLGETPKDATGNGDGRTPGAVTDVAAGPRDAQTPNGSASGAGTSSGGTTRDTTQSSSLNSTPGTVTRTAPYDYGCLTPSQCDDADTKNGHLRSAAGAQPCLYYGPPFAGACSGDFGSSSGVRVDVNSSTTSVDASADVHLDSSMPARDLQACLSFVDDSNQYGYFQLGCQPVPTTGSVTIYQSFDVSAWQFPSGRLLVSLQGDGAAFVDSISYAVR